MSGFFYHFNDQHDKINIQSHLINLNLTFYQNKVHFNYIFMQFSVTHWQKLLKQPILFFWKNMNDI